MPLHFQYMNLVQTFFFVMFAVTLSRKKKKLPLTLFTQNGILPNEQFLYITRLCLDVEPILKAEE